MALASRCGVYGPGGDGYSLEYVNFKTKAFIRLKYSPWEWFSVGWGKKEELSSNGKTAGATGLRKET